jgi:maleate isomerase
VRLTDETSRSQNLEEDLLSGGAVVTIARGKAATGVTPVQGPVRQYGVGVVAPYDFALDRELWRWTPENVSLYVTRIPSVAEPVTVDMATMISEPDVVSQATRDLLTPRPSVVAYACTSGSFVAGVAGEQALRRTMLSAAAPAAVTTCSALIDALQTLGIRRLAVLTPYIDSLTERLVDFLSGYGVKTTNSVGLGLLSDIWTLPYHEIVRQVRALDTPEAEAIFVSCTNVPTYDIIGPLERELGKPVLSANQVTMWASLRAAGLPAPRCGQLLFQPERVPVSTPAVADLAPRSLFRIRVKIPDETGKLAQLSQSVALTIHRPMTR